MTTCNTCSQVIDVFKKRNCIIRVTLTDSSDITGAKVWFSVKKGLLDADLDALILKKNGAAGGDDTQARVVDGPGGIIEIYLKPSDTEDIDAGDYWYDVVLETAAPLKVQLVDPSRFSLYDAVTQT